MTRKWLFAGPISPEHERISFPAMRVVSENPQKNFQGTIFFKASDGQVLGTADVPDGMDASIVSMVVRQQVQYRVDVEGFVLGGAYDFQVRYIAPVEEIDKLETMQSRSSALVEVSDVNRRRDLVREVTPTKFTGKEAHVLKHALADLRLSVIEPSLTPFFAYRVAESIRQYFVLDPRDPRAKSWNAMHEALRTDRDDLLTQEPATSVRHGEVHEFDESKGTAYIQLASRLVEAFLLYIGRR